jgi:hypothetical protein
MTGWFVNTTSGEKGGWIRETERQRDRETERQRERETDGQNEWRRQNYNYLKLRLFD